jgi:S-adenosylmethionine uptake transporter
MLVTTNNVGVMFLILSIAFGCLNDVISKKMGVLIPSSEIVFFRFFIGSIILIPFMKKSDYKRLLNGQHSLLNIVRSLLGVLSIWLCTYSIIHLKLVEVTVLLWTVPLFELLLSKLFFRDGTKSQILLAGVCFLSIAIFSTGFWDPNSFSNRSHHFYVLPLVAAMFFAIQDVIIRKIGTNKKCDLQMLFSFSVIATFGSLCMISGDWAIPPLINLFHLTMLGIFSNLTQYCLFIAFRCSSLSYLAPIRYIELIVQASFGFVFFREVPTSSNLICAVILAFITLYTIKNNNDDQKNAY